MAANHFTNRSKKIQAPTTVMDPIQVTDEDHGSQDQKAQDDRNEASLRLEKDEADACGEFQASVKAIIDGVRKPYEPMSEDPPKLPAYHPSFIEVEDLCTALVKGAEVLLQRSTFQDGETARLIQLAKDSQSIIYPPAMRIGLMGDSSVGKSTLINALLDSPRLAIEGASGHAATNVITEYQAAWPRQKEAFMAEIVFFGRDKIRTIIQNEFRAYYDYSFGDLSTVDQETQVEMSFRYETAIETFKAVFADKDEFCDDKAIEDFFSTATGAADKNILQTLYRWIEGTTTKHQAEEGLVYMTAHTVEELSRKVEPFVRTSTQLSGEESRPCLSLWPLVEIVRVGLQRLLLQRGTVLADLPGLSDVNKIRTRSTTQYIRNCEAILLVAPVHRVESDNTVHKRLGEISRMLGSQKALILTKIDDTKGLYRASDLEPAAEAAKAYERLCAASGFKTKQIARIIKLRDHAAGKEKEDLTRQIRELQFVNLDFIEIDADRLRMEKKGFSALDREALVLMRNEKTKRNLRRKYKKMTSDPLPLAIFAVSSVDYNVQKLGYNGDEDFPLSVSTSGIPELRRHCFQFPAKSRLDALTHYREGILAELINSLYIWSSQYKVQRRSALRKIAMKPLQEAEDKIRRYIQEIKMSLDDTALEKSRKRYDHWIEHSMNALGKWTSWHPATFNAFCKHDGMWQTSLQPYRNWNAEMLEPVVKDMAGAWDDFDEALIDCTEKCDSELRGSLDDIRHDLNDMGGVAAEPMLPFLASLTPRKVQLRKCLQDFSKKIKVVSRAAKLNVDMIDEDSDCFLMQAMAPIYAKCARQKSTEGNRVRQSLSTARKTLMEDALSKGEQFSKICPGIRETIEAELDVEQAKLLDSVHTVFRKVIEDFDLMFIVEELPDPNRDTLRRQVQVFVKEAKAMVNGPIEMEFAKATKDSA